MDDTSDMMDIMSLTPLHLATMGLEGSLPTLLDPYFRDINAQDRCGMTPLHWACSCNNLEATETLLQWGAQVDIQDRQGAVPLHHACRSGNIAIITAILGADSNVHRMDHHCETALFYVREPSVLATLIQHGADLDHKSRDGQTAMHYAAGDAERQVLLQHLLDHGADINITNHDNYTPLMTAVAKDCVGCLEVLLRNGAGMEGLTRRTGSNVLHLAGLKAGPATFDLLRRNISSFELVDPDALDAELRTPSKCFISGQAMDNVGNYGASEDVQLSWDTLVGTVRQHNIKQIAPAIRATPQDATEEMAGTIMPGSFPGD